MGAKLDAIINTLEPLGWKCITTKYQNLDTEMHFQCPKGHDVYTTWRLLRDF